MKMDNHALSRILGTRPGTGKISQGSFLAWSKGHTYHRLSPTPTMAEYFCLPFWLSRETRLFGGRVGIVPMAFKSKGQSGLVAHS